MESFQAIAERSLLYSKLGEVGGDGAASGGARLGDHPSARTLRLRRLPRDSAEPTSVASQKH